MTYWVATPEARDAGERRRPPLVELDAFDDDLPDAPTSCMTCGADCTDRVCCSSGSYVRVELELGERIRVVVHDDPTCADCCPCSSDPARFYRPGAHAEGPGQ